MYKWIKYYLFLPSVLFVSVGYRNVQGPEVHGMPAGDPFTGTKWTASVAKGCTDSLVFRSGHRVRIYSCEVDEWYDGSYRISKDTVIVSWVSESEDGGGKEHWRNRYFFTGNLLRPINNQGYSHGKWEKPELSDTSAGYVFRKDVSGPARVGIVKASKARTAELLLDPGFRGTIRLYTAPDKKRQVKLLRHNVKAEDWIYFVVRASNDSMFQASAEYSIQGHIADGWIDRNEHIGVYSRVYEDGKGLVLYAAPGKGDVIAKIPHDVRTLIPVIGCEGGWVKVRMTDKGKVFEGWLSPEEQCADAYTTCN